MEVNAPLTPDELRQLDHLMKIQGGMRLPYLHGYLVSIIGSPELLNPDDWLLKMWEGRQEASQHPLFSASMEGIRRLYNSIRQQLEENKPLYPLLSCSNIFSQEVLVNDPALVQWCYGYMKGVGFTAGTWHLPEHRKAYALLISIVLGSGDKEIMEKYLEPWVTEDDLGDARIANIKQLSTIISEIDTYWTSATQRPRYTITVAIHRLCLCGSGKPFKTCCSKAILH